MGAVRFYADISTALGGSEIFHHTSATMSQEDTNVPVHSLLELQPPPPPPPEDNWTQQWRSWLSARYAPMASPPPALERTDSWSEELPALPLLEPLPPLETRGNRPPSPPPSPPRSPLWEQINLWRAQPAEQPSDNISSEDENGELPPPRLPPPPPPPSQNNRISPSFGLWASFSTVTEDAPTFIQLRSRMTQEQQNKALEKLKKENYNPMPRRISRRLNLYYRDDNRQSFLEKENEEDDGKNCPICLEDFEPREEVTLTPCSHMFHENCIVPWIKDRGHCPLCRFAFCG